MQSMRKQLIEYQAMKIKVRRARREPKREAGEFQPSLENANERIVASGRPGSISAERVE
jgi:hypothetical protein